MVQLEVVSADYDFFFGNRLRMMEVVIFYISSSLFVSLNNYPIKLCSLDQFTENLGRKF